MLTPKKTSEKITNLFEKCITEVIKIMQQEHYPLSTNLLLVTSKIERLEVVITQKCGQVQVVGKEREYDGNLFDLTSSSDTSEISQVFQWPCELVCIYLNHYLEKAKEKVNWSEYIANIHLDLELSVIQGGSKLYLSSTHPSGIVITFHFDKNEGV